MTKPCLFISYDGLLDPLGQSQILPYLFAVAKHPRKVYILSFEKAANYHKNFQDFKKKLDNVGIVWQPLTFTRKFRYLGKLYDFVRMYLMAAWLVYKYQISIIHARGHISAQVGLFCKKIFNTQLLFDCRGLWVDEKIDKGGWDLQRRLDRVFYNYFKKQERNLMSKADSIVVLTKAVLKELPKLGVSNPEKVRVIPCCADFAYFKVFNYEQKQNQRNKHAIPIDAFVIGYVGSLGKMYMLDFFLKCFSKLLDSTTNVYALIITPDTELAKQEVEKNLSRDYRRLVKCISGTRAEMPTLIPIMDVMLSFIKPSYARLATSPTKIAESLACGVPVISNPGIGDVSDILTELEVGYTVEDPEDFIKILDAVKFKDPVKIRNASQTIFDLEIANKVYKEIYQKLQKESIC